MRETEFLSFGMTFAEVCGLFVSYGTKCHTLQEIDGLFTVSKKFTSLSPFVLATGAVHDCDGRRER